MDVQKRIKDLSRTYKSELIKIRRYLHQNPELSFQEKNTAKFICEYLDKQNIPYQSKIAKTGILAVIEGKKPNKNIIALRADMDALPVLEENKIQYKSQNEGVMHACGHDVHMASLIGSARILKEISDSFSGTVLIIFQPGEEKLPGGAKLMMEEGIFKRYEPDCVIGQHVDPSLEVGNVGFGKGKYMASTDEIYIKVKGKGGHAAMPHLLKDPVIMASHIILALQQLVSRKADPMVPNVLSFGKFIADGATNVIPDEVTIEGTFRTYNENWRGKMHEHIVNTVKDVSSAFGGSCEVEIVKGYPMLVNDVSLTEKVMSFTRDFIGDRNVTDLKPQMISEDFAYFAQKYPSVFYRLGTMNAEKNIISSLHTPTFDVDENVFGFASGIMSWMAYNLMSEIK